MENFVFARDLVDFKVIFKNLTCNDSFKSDETSMIR